MSRDDSVLYSGSSSVSFGSNKVQPQRQKLTDKKKEDKIVLTPAGERIKAILEDEKRKTILKVLAQVSPDTREEQTSNLLAALNLYTQSMIAVTTKIDNILRDN